MNVFKEFKGTFEVDKDFYNVFKASCSTDETRYFLNHVYFDGEYFVATDGRRLVVHSPQTTYPENLKGFYEPVKIGKKFKLIPVECNGVFPDFKRILPDEEKYDLFKVTLPDDHTKRVFTFKGNMFDDSRTLGLLVLTIGHPFNFDFVSKTLKGIKDIQILTNSSNPILFKLDSNTKYIVQPML